MAMTEVSSQDPRFQDATPAGADAAAGGFTQQQIEALFINAAREGDAELLSSFLDAGMDPNLRAEKGYTPLILASYNGYVDAVALLLARGAQPDLQDEKGATALAGVAFKGNLAIARLLLDAGAGVDVSNSVGRTPLMFAVMFGRDDMAKLLLKAGASPTRRDGENLNALDLAHRQGNTVLTALMKEDTRAAS
ncbi:MAG: ankyrin repeat domain-containing protein [Acetobacter indonesiensis]|nr:ankyrin repeat domain-containing protein [Acetobacter indonesiensis]MCI1546553.1 ankyrin repeat domain-containing protein [Acetobacter indonesiensis]MCI1765946.1 ankyrin repeat domain-containing protein [Acetobacter indonesiensis]